MLSCSTDETSVLSDGHGHDEDGQQDNEAGPLIMVESGEEDDPVPCCDTPDDSGARSPCRALLPPLLSCWAPLISVKGFGANSGVGVAAVVARILTHGLLSPVQAQTSHIVFIS